MNDISADTIRTMWTVSLVIYAVVVVVVATLLTLILRAARDIRAGVSGIWTVGQQIANNTIHIALLDATTHVVASAHDAYLQEARESVRWERRGPLRRLVRRPAPA